MCSPLNMLIYTLKTKEKLLLKDICVINLTKKGEKNVVLPGQYCTF